MKRAVNTASRTMIIVLSLMMAAAIARGLVFTFKPRSIQQPQKKIKSYDPALLRRLNQLARTMDMRGSCAYEGVVNIIDGADSSNDVHHAPVIFCKSGDECYYRYGSTELVNRGGFNIYIQHEQRNIWVSRQKPVSADAMPNPSGLPDLAGENYELSSSFRDGYGTISLKNSKHVTCKEYTLSYDTASNRVTFIHARLSDIKDPLNSHKDKIVDMAIASWTDRPEWSKYPDYTRFFAIESQGVVRLLPAFSSYSLTNTLR